MIKMFDPHFVDFLEAIKSSGIREYLLTVGADPTFYKYLLFMKSPMFVFDIGSLMAGIYYFEDPAIKMRFTRLWSVNPVILYGIYMFGQTDIMPAALVALGILAIKKRRNYVGVLLLAAAALFKTFAVFLMFPVLIIISRSFREFMKYAAIAFALFAAVVVPLYISSGGYVIISFFPRFYVENTDGALFYWIDKLVFVFLYLLSVYLCFRVKINKGGMGILEASISSIMLLYTLFFVPVHYFIWVVPLLMIAVCARIVPFWLYCLQITGLFVCNLNSQLTTTWLFAPVNPGFFLNLPGLPDIMHLLSVKWGVVMLVSRMVFTVSCVFIAFRMYGLLGVFDGGNRSMKMK